MSNESIEPLPPRGRLISAGMAGAAAIGLLINHFTMDRQSVANLMILALAPIALFLGIGGMVEPKILWSVGKYGKHLPVIYKLIGGALGALGVAVMLLLLLFVYRLGPPEHVDKPKPRLPNRVAAAAASSSKTNSNPPIPAAKSERHLTPQDVRLLTYDRPQKRWVPIDEQALPSVRREDEAGVTTLHYTEGENALLKVLWPNVLEVGDRFTVEVKGANSLELVDLEGADANARASRFATDAFVQVEFVRAKDQIAFSYDGQPQTPFYASGKLRGNEAKSALLATSLRPAFTIKKGEQASFRNAKIFRP